MMSDVRFVIDALVLDIVPKVDVPVILSVVPFILVIVAFGLEILTEFAID